jgi:hypothetical protein
VDAVFVIATVNLIRQQRATTLHQRVQEKTYSESPKTNEFIDEFIHSTKYSGENSDGEHGQFTLRTAPLA